jgi:acyl carrier protein
VLFLEETWGIRLEAHEASPDNLDTIALIAGFVHSKKA